MRQLAAGFWLLAGTMHFVVPKSYEAIVPARLRERRKEVVVWSGVAEIAGGALILPGPTRRFAPWWLLATLPAVSPPNIERALTPELSPKTPAAALGGRLPLHFLFAWVTWRGTEYPSRR